MKITKKMQEVIDIMLQLIPKENEFSFAQNVTISMNYEYSDGTGSCEEQCSQNCAYTCKWDCAFGNGGNGDH
ncbi:MAG: hypothetical protein OWP43_09325 [Sphaerochaetaceae bacterium]|nr:hypothetical protein [Sphaerochaetaceae bacterium]